MGTFVRVSALSGRLWAASAPLRASNPGKEEFLRPFALVSARLSAAVLEVFGSSPPRFRTTPQPSFGAAGPTTPIYRPIASQRNRAKQKCTGGVVLARSRPGGSGPDMGRRRCKLGRETIPGAVSATEVHPSPANFGLSIQCLAQNVQRATRVVQRAASRNSGRTSDLDVARSDLEWGSLRELLDAVRNQRCLHQNDGYGNEIYNLRATSRKQKATCGEDGNVAHPAHSSPLRPLRPEPRKIPNAVS